MVLVSCILHLVSLFHTTLFNKFTRFRFNFKTILFSIFWEVSMKRKQCSSNSFWNQRASKNIRSENKLKGINRISIKDIITKYKRRKIRVRKRVSSIDRIRNTRSKINYQLLILLSITKTRNQILTINLVIIWDKLFFKRLGFEINNTRRSKPQS